MVSVMWQYITVDGDGGLSDCVFRRHQPDWVVTVDYRILFFVRIGNDDCPAMQNINDGT